MKPRLPRKLKKAMKTEQRLFDKKMGFKWKKRSSEKRFMYQLYLNKLYGLSLNYNTKLTLEDLVNYSIREPKSIHTPK